MMNFPRLACLVLLLSLAACNASPGSHPRRIDAHHLVRFENEYVRVIETRIEPGDETSSHAHPNEAVVIFLTGGRLRITDDDDASHESTLDADTVVFDSAPAVHRTANVGPATVRTVAVEILARPPARGVEPAEAPGVPLLDNEQVYVSRIRLSVGDAVNLSGSTPSVLVALNSGTLMSGSIQATLHAGWPLWCEAEPLAPRYDTGRGADFEAIVVTLKPRAEAAE